MNASTRSGLTALGAALLLGLLGDALLRAVPWGLNLTLWLGAFAVCFLTIRRRQSAPPAASERGLLVGLLVFAVAFVWRDSPTLKTLDALAIVTVLSLLVTRTEPTFILTCGVGEYFRSLLRLGVEASFGVFSLVFRDIAWNTLPRTGWTRHGLAVARGLAIALPLLIFFGGLLAAADAVFSHFVGLAFHWDLTALINHLLLTLLCAWLSGGLLRALRPFPDAAASTLTASTLTRLSQLTLGRVETGLVLGLLNVLFLSFVLVQMRYFFGGASLVQATVGLTYAQYARQGFFELVAVAALVLPLLLALHALQRPEDEGGQRLYRRLAGAQVVLLGVIMASAAQRMHLYQNEYGQTELRLYTSMFMGWLGVVFLWFALTVLRGRRSRFAFGALLSAFAAVLTLHALNPDATIVRANMAHAQAGHTFDAVYATSLSADALPALVSALPHLTLADQTHIAQHLQQQRRVFAQQDWRSWSLAHALAWQALRTEH